MTPYYIRLTIIYNMVYKTISKSRFWNGEDPRDGRASVHGFGHKWLSKVLTRKVMEGRPAGVSSLCAPR